MGETVNENHENGSGKKGHAEIVTIFENDRFIVLNKPAGVLSIPDRIQSEPSLKDMLIGKYGSIFTVHRLDKILEGELDEFTEALAAEDRRRALETSTV